MRWRHFRFKLPGRRGEIQIRAGCQCGMVVCRLEPGEQKTARTRGTWGKDEGDEEDRGARLLRNACKPQDGR